MTITLLFSALGAKSISFYPADLVKLPNFSSQFPSFSQLIFSLLNPQIKRQACINPLGIVQGFNRSQFLLKFLEFCG